MTPRAGPDRDRCDRCDSSPVAEVQVWRRCMSREHDLDQRLRFLKIDERGRAALRSLRPLLDEELPGALETLYDQLAQLARDTRLAYPRLTALVGPVARRPSEAGGTGMAQSVTYDDRLPGLDRRPRPRPCKSGLGRPQYRQASAAAPGRATGPRHDPPHLAQARPVPRQEGSDRRSGGRGHGGPGQGDDARHGLRPVRGPCRRQSACGPKRPGRHRGRARRRSWPAPSDVGLERLAEGDLR